MTTINQKSIQAQGLYENTIKVISQKIPKFRLPKYKSSINSAANDSSLSQKNSSSFFSTSKKSSSSSKNKNNPSAQNIEKLKVVLHARDLELLNKPTYFLVIGFYKNNKWDNTTPIFIDKKTVKIKVDGQKVPINNLTYNIDHNSYEKAPQFIDIGYHLGLKNARKSATNYEKNGKNFTKSKKPFGFGVFKFYIELQNLNPENNDKFAEILVIKKVLSEKEVVSNERMRENMEDLFDQSVTLEKRKEGRKNSGDGKKNRPAIFGQVPEGIDENDDDDNNKENLQKEQSSEEKLTNAFLVTTEDEADDEMLPPSEMPPTDINETTTSECPASPKLAEIYQRTQHVDSLTNSLTSSPQNNNNNRSIPHTSSNSTRKYKRIEQFIQSLEAEDEKITEKNLITFLKQQNQNIMNETSINASTENFIRIKLKCPITMQCLKSSFVIRYHPISNDQPSLTDHFQPLHAKDLIAYQKQLNKQKSRTRKQKQRAFFNPDTFEFPKYCPLTRDKSYKTVKRQPFLFKNCLDPSIPGCLEADYCDIYLDEDDDTKLNFRYGTGSAGCLENNVGESVTISSQESYGEGTRSNKVMKIKEEKFDFGDEMS